jgi:hypothetical protein
MNNNKSVNVLIITILMMGLSACNSKKNENSLAAGQIITDEGDNTISNPIVLEKQNRQDALTKAEQELQKMELIVRQTENHLENNNQESADSMQALIAQLKSESWIKATETLENFSVEETGQEDSEERMGIDLAEKVIFNMSLINNLLDSQTLKEIAKKE